MWGNPFDGIGKYLIGTAVLIFLAGAGTVGLLWLLLG